MQLGLVTYNWGKDWDLPTLIKNCEMAEFHGVELRSTHQHGVEPSLNKAQRSEVAKQFGDSDVRIVGLGTACEYDSPDAAKLKKNIEETKAFVMLCHDIGGTGIKVRPNRLHADVPVEKTIDQIGRSLVEVGEFAADYGVSIRVEVHGRGTADIPIFKRIMDAANHSNVGACWNCNPDDLKGAGLEKNFQLLRNRFADVIHIHDLISDYPWPRLFKRLRDTNYEGWTLVEEGGQTADPVRVMKYYRLAWEPLAHA